MTAAIVCSNLSFSWPDGAPVLSGVTLSLGPGLTGLIGVNGSGKSTLLRLIAGELRPGSGLVRADGEVGYLPQATTLGTHRRVSDLLGIGAARDALHAIEAGDVGEGFFAAVGDDWDVEEQARAWLDRLGLAGLGLDDRVARLSGGETILVALAALFLRRPDILLLDEPTNNLDQDARQRLCEAVASWTGVMIIVSHDRELLGLVDQIADLSGRSDSVPRSCWPSPHLSCCCSTSRPTTWTWRRSGSCPKRWRAIAARSSWPVMTFPSCVRRGSPAGSVWTATPA